MDELYQLRVEPEFRRLVAPLTLTELKNMEDSLNSPDSTKEVRVWRNTILVDYENGMGVSIGRIREDSVYEFKFVGLSHNTVRGAAGGAVLCAELLKAKGYIQPK